MLLLNVKKQDSINSKISSQRDNKMTENFQMRIITLHQEPHQCLQRCHLAFGLSRCKASRSLLNCMSARSVCQMTLVSSVRSLPWKPALVQDWLRCHSWVSQWTGPCNTPELEIIRNQRLWLMIYLGKYNITSLVFPEQVHKSIKLDVQFQARLHMLFAPNEE